MADEKGYLSLLSSVGITLHHPDGLTTIPTPIGVSRRALLAEASALALSPLSHNSLAGRIAQQIRTSREPDLPSAPVPGSITPLDFSQADECDGRLYFSSVRFSSDQLIERLEKLGLKLQEQLETDEGDIDEQINPARVAAIAEVIRRTDGRVIGGGKGLTRQAARVGAIAEAAERVVGANPKVPVFVNSARRLREEHGLLIPRFDVGPRDAYSDDLVIDWVKGQTLDGIVVGLPAERALYDYAPRSGVSAFTWQHTAGLAAGSSREEAIWAGLSELMERDAYWLAMRCRARCPTIDNSIVFDARPKLAAALGRAGLRIIMRNFSLDWPLTIVSAVAVDVTGRIPAFAHGMGSGTNLAAAALKALLECLQLHFGLSRRCSEARQAVLFGEVCRRPDLAWSDPGSAQELDHLLSADVDGFAIPDQSANQDSQNILRLIREKSGDIFWVDLGELEGVHVVRVYLPDALLPEPNLEHVPARLATWLRRANLRYAYAIPILT